MPPLTSDRNTVARIGDDRAGLLAANVTIHAGALVMRNADGYLLPGKTATNLMGVGRAEHPSDNAAGADGDQRVTFRTGVFRYANAGGGDAISRPDIGTICFAVDDQTVARTDGTGTRSRAGIVEDVDAQGVWVRLDEALTRAAN